VTWLATHAYIAAWASPLIALIGIIISNTVSAKAPDWSRLMIYIGFLTSLAVLFTPTMDEWARDGAGIILIPLTGFIIIDAAIKGDFKG
jgi:hypothetical protein